MPRGRVASVTIALNAGTAQLAIDLQKAGTTLEQFGQRARGAGRSAGAGFVEASALARVFDGNLNLNTRSVARFMTQVLGLGPIIKLAFPVIGGVMFAEMLSQLYKKVTDFQNSVKYASDNIRNSFRPAIDSLRSSNDDLAIQLAKVNMEIDKLMGKRENNLSLMIAEAIKLVDQLGTETLDTIQKIGAELEKNNVGKFRAFITGEGRTTDIQRHFVGVTGSEGSLKKIDDATEAARAQFVKDTSNLSGTSEQQKAAVKVATDKAVAAVNKVIQDELDWVTKEWTTREASAAPKITSFKVSDKETRFGTIPGTNESVAFKDLTEARKFLEERQSATGLKFNLFKGESTQQGLQAGAEGQSLTKAIKDRIALLQTEQAEAEAKLKSVGATEAQTVAYESQAQALKQIAELNKIQQKPGAPKESVSSADAAKIQDILAKTIKAGLDATTAAEFSKAIDQTKERTHATLALAAAVGKGYEATKLANVEEQLRAKYAEHLTDTEWMQANASKLHAEGTALLAEYDAKYAEQTNRTAQALQNQLRTEQEVAAATLKGAAAVAEANNQAKIREIFMTNALPIAMALAMIQQKIFDSERLVKYNESLKSVNDSYERAAAGIGAAFLGPAAKRQAEAEAHAKELAKQLGVSVNDPAIQKDIQASQLEYWAKISEEVGKTKGAYEEQISHLQDMLAVVKARETVEGKTVENMALERTYLADILRLQAQETLQSDKAYAGFKAFFLEMQADAMSAAQQIAKDLDAALHSIVDQSSSEIAKAMTGQKTSFGKMFQSEGTKLLSGAVKTDMTNGLSKLGEVIFGKDKNPLAKLAKRDGQNASSAWWVQLVDKSALPSVSANGAGGAGAGGSPVSSSGSSVLRSVGKVIAAILGINSGGGGGGAAGNGTSVTSSVSYGGEMAEGGIMLPGNAYLTSEAGPELITGISGRVHSNAQSQRMLASGGGGGSYYAIDARGTDPVLTEARVRAAIQDANRDAIRRSVRANRENLSRVPHRA